MSKVDALRALREARYAAASAKAPVPVNVTVTPVRVVTAVDPEGAGSCGHRSINNRSCTRVAGHPEKNHRYN